MATKKNDYQIYRAQLGKESLNLVIKRSGVPKSKIIENALHVFLVNNIDLLTPEERLKYSEVILDFKNKSKRCGLDEAMDDVKNGRVHTYKSSQDMLNSVL